MIAPDVLRFVRSALPPTPTRVLEIGAGGGELAGELREDGYDVVAIDPASETPAVRAIALGDLEEPPASFDAAVAIVSLHHVEPLAASCRRLAELMRPGGRLVVDEFDVERFDTGAAAWWLARREPDGHEPPAPADVVADLRDHIHPLSRLRAVLAEWFELGEPVRGPYLYRWDMPPGLLDAEEELIATGRLPATGARLVGTRR
jgi:SAM-dependent methyltransferase